MKEKNYVEFMWKEGPIQRVEDWNYLDNIHIIMKKQSECTYRKISGIGPRLCENEYKKTVVFKTVIKRIVFYRL